MSWRGANRAQALVWLSLLVPLFISMAGLAIDGAILLAGRRELQSVADGAARAGATKVDLGRLRDSDGADVELDPVAARVATQSYLDGELTREVTWDTHPNARIDIQPRRVRVALQGTLRTAFLRIASLDEVPVEASAFADVRFGIRTGGGS
jgi:Flp pilus assembly protein TadG